MDFSGFLSLFYAQLTVFLRCLSVCQCDATVSFVPAPFFQSATPAPATAAASTGVGYINDYTYYGNGLGNSYGNGGYGGYGNSYNSYGGSVCIAGICANTGYGGYGGGSTSLTCNSGACYPSTTTFSNPSGLNYGYGGSYGNNLYCPTTGLCYVYGNNNGYYGHNGYHGYNGNSYYNG